MVGAGDAGGLALPFSLPLLHCVTARANPPAPMPPHRALVRPCGMLVRRAAHFISTSRPPWHMHAPAFFTTTTTPPPKPSTYEPQQHLATVNRRRFLISLLLPRPSQAAFCSLQLYLHRLRTAFNEHGLLQWWR